MDQYEYEPSGDDDQSTDPERVPLQPTHGAASSLGSLTARLTPSMSVP